ncbi:hypothetical protein PDESU_01204 [Pontiella desulfatans]|uniref:Uncharacterized protein n=1 Tax=Pontiella desulfatans TaxID=2750659 RepID=A0A6C2TZ62_PONDE|nr:hypothetical protein [Pontiella desulfatans]VGO12651.1 hypothetical protein PDESU_01204 [Pontiella desulfatans]
MSYDPFADALAPFAGWNLAATYDRYYALFDLIIYCTIFIALCQAVFGTRFRGRPGKALATALGIMLGTGLAISEAQFGWNLRMAGGLAAIIMLILFGLLLFHLLHQLGMKWDTAALVAYIIIYLLTAGIYPKVLRDAPALVLIAAIAFLVCTWKLIMRLWPHGKPGNDAGFVAMLDRKREKSEVKQIAKTQGRELPEAQKEDRRIEKTLKGLKTELEHSNPDFKEVAQATAAIAHKTDDVIRTLDKVRIMDRRLRNFDWHELQQLREYCKELGEDDRKKLQQQILLERKKILEEHAIEQMLKTAETRHRELRRQIDTVATHAQAQSQPQTLSAVVTALRMEQQLNGELKQIKKAERKLKSLTRLKLKDEKKVAKQQEIKFHR